MFGVVVGRRGSERSFRVMTRSGVVEVPTAVMAYGLNGASSWWEKINECRVWQDRIFHVLAALYGVVAAVALVCLFRNFN